MDDLARRNLSGTLVATATAAGSVAGLLALDAIVDDNAPTLLLVLVLLAASWYGALPTFVATLLCLAADAWFFLEPQNSFIVESTSDRLRLLVFAFIGALLGLYGEKRLRSHARAERRLRESEARKAAMISTALDAIITIDHRGRVVEFNQAAEEMFGWRQAEARGQPLAELVIPPEMRERHNQGIERRLRTGQGRFLNRHLELTALRRDGSRFPIELSITLIDTMDPPLFTGFIRDITERQQAESALRESAARLAKADRHKDEFLATLAHELRNPLAPIRTGLTVMKMAKGDPAILDKVHNTLERQTEQLITLVDDLMDVSRITRGKLELRRIRTQLSVIVQSAVEASRPLMDEACHRLKVSLPEDDPALYCDPHRLAQVLSNLLNNAARYTPKGGDISLEARVEDKEAVISVRDTGIGIPPARREQIFEMFMQIASPMEGARGLGIGLTLARSIMEMHGGSIEVRSEGENRGSEFTVRLPLSEPTAAPDQDLLAEAK